MSEPTAPQIQTPKIKGSIKITAELQNPTGVWEKTIKVEYGPGQELPIILQVLATVRNTGLVNTVGTTKVTLIPEARVVGYTAELNLVQLGDPLALAAATGKVSLA